jgi:hypothetical protein
MGAVAEAKAIAVAVTEPWEGAVAVAVMEAVADAGAVAALLI